MYSPEIMQLVQKGIIKKAAFLSLLSRALRMRYSKAFSLAGLLEFVSLTMWLWGTFEDADF